MLSASPSIIPYSDDSISLKQLKLTMTRNSNNTTLKRLNKNQPLLQSTLTKKNCESILIYFLIMNITFKNFKNNLLIIKLIK